MKSLAGRLIESITEDRDSIVAGKIDLKLQRLGLEYIKVGEVKSNLQGDQFVRFIDSEGEIMDVVFAVDNMEPIAVIAEPIDEDDTLIVIELAPLMAPIEKSELGYRIVLSDTSWMNKSFFIALFSGGAVKIGDDVKVETDNVDAWGNKIIERYAVVNDHKVKFTSDKYILKLREGKVYRGSGTVKLAVVREKKSSSLSFRAREALHSASKKFSFTEKKRKSFLKIKPKVKK